MVWVFLFFQLLKFKIIFQRIHDIPTYSILDRETGKRNLPDNDWYKTKFLKRLPLLQHEQPH